ncbi:hypothetical protein [Algoriphagus confluentis]|uniref:Uncharacterized protein n=1 Tax=Algoriphagus confluentis TaxID=1697556 RepID=A0ABQ6PRM6_9BACT|nr:hypothetical protein Aconfl_32780 [Algoriphagus confluentis]
MELNKLEISILKRLTVLCPNIVFHIPYLEVVNRDITGVGMFVYLEYSKRIEKSLNLGKKNTSISTNEIIQIKDLKYGLCYEVSISDDKIKYIELVTNGEDWTGNIPDNFSFK